MKIPASVVLLPALALFAIAEAVVYVRSPLPREWRLRRAILHLAAAGYAAWILSMTVFPVALGMPDDPFRRPLMLVPFGDIRAYLASGNVDLIVHDVLGNVLVFAPCGMLLPLLWRRLDGWLGVLLGTALFSVAIEVTQYVEGTYRVASVDDVWLNVLGGVLGFTFLLAYRSFRGRHRRTAPLEDGKAA